MPPAINVKKENEIRSGGTKPTTKYMGIIYFMLDIELIKFESFPYISHKKKKRRNLLNYSAIYVSE